MSVAVMEVSSVVQSLADTAVVTTAATEVLRMVDMEVTEVLQGGGVVH